MRRIFIMVAIAVLAVGPMLAITLENIAFGNMNQWVKRTIKESSVIGGNTRTLYEIAPNATIEGSKP